MVVPVSGTDSAGRTLKVCLFYIRPNELTCSEAAKWLQGPPMKTDARGRALIWEGRVRALVVHLWHLSLGAALLGAAIACTHHAHGTGVWWSAWGPYGLLLGVGQYLQWACMHSRGVWGLLLRWGDSLAERRFRLERGTVAGTAVVAVLAGYG
jgi:hypothetical protein